MCLYTKVLTIHSVTHTLSPLDLIPLTNSITIIFKNTTFCHVNHTRVCTANIFLFNRVHIGMKNWRTRKLSGGPKSCFMLCLGWWSCGGFRSVILPMLYCSFLVQNKNITEEILQTVFILNINIPCNMYNQSYILPSDTTPCIQ